MKRLIVVLFICVLIVLGYFFFQYKSSTNESMESRKTVEDYFVEKMNVDRTEAKKIAQNGVLFRVSKEATLKGIVGNLYYYGFIDNEDKFTKLLETTKDTTGSDAAIIVGNNTIDINSNYSLNYAMSDEEIANILLNKGEFDPNFTRYDYLFMPGMSEAN